MKKFLALILALVMVLSLAACGNEPAESGNEDGAEEQAQVKVALLSNQVGTNPFLVQMVEGLNDYAAEKNLDVTNVEVADSAEYEENIRAFAEEGYNLIIGGGWESGEALAKVSAEYPETAFALIDSSVDSDNVKCITYREQESYYLVGVVASLVADGEFHTFGGVHVNEGSGSWQGRYGFMEGVKSVDPDAEFIFNYTGSYDDPAKGKEYALQIAAQGAGFINASAAACNSGVFEAAAEKEFYTSGVDVDQTDANNPFIVSSCIKDTYTTIQKIIACYLEDWNTENEEWGVAEGALGAVWANYESVNPMSERLSEDDLAVLKQAADDIASGAIDLKTLPDEASYK